MTVILDGLDCEQGFRYSEPCFFTKFCLPKIYTLVTYKK